MAGLIKREDIDAVRERARIEEIVGEHVTLKTAGVGSMKGLCPFHDERTPSFHVRPALGAWHCFGCDEGGDTISFVQKINHLSFTEAVEYLAAKTGVTLRYEGGGGPRRGPEPGRRQRLLEAHRVAEQFYREHLNSPEGKKARDFLKGRGFGFTDVEKFGVGSAPAGWDGLVRHLRAKGFTEEELTSSGLAIQGNRGPYDRFRDRVLWPIRDLTGATVGFGARRLDEDPKSPKYLNSPETLIYKKSQALYGIDIAKKAIARGRKVVIVEGYTDVMAAHAAGEETAVATCGTAFGGEHTQIIRRLLGDVSSPAAGVVLSSGRGPGGEVIFTFDGDEAGKAAARRAYVEDQAFAAQTFVAVDPNGMDPCDVRLKYGDQALRDLVAARVPLFEFVLRSVLAELDLNSAEGRVQGLRVCAPVLAGIKDRALQAEYTRQVAGWLGMEPRDVEGAIHSVGRYRGAQHGSQHVPQYAAQHGAQAGPPYGPQGAAQPGSQYKSSRVVPTDPVTKTERHALVAVIQRPLDVVGAGFETLEPASFVDPLSRAVFEVIGAEGGLDQFFEVLSDAEKEVGVGEGSVDLATRRWVDKLRESADPAVAEQITGFLVTPLPVEQGGVRDYAQGIVRALVRRDLNRKAANLQAALRRAEEGSEEYTRAFRELMEIENKRREYADVVS